MRAGGVGGYAATEGLIARFLPFSAGRCRLLAGQVCIWPNDAEDLPVEVKNSCAKTLSKTQYVMVAWACSHATKGALS